jgi:hypothetical protein
MQIKATFNPMMLLLSPLIVGMMAYVPIVAGGNAAAAEGATQQPTPLDVRQQNQVDLLFLQKNLSAGDAEKLRQQLNLYGDTDAGAQQIIKMFKDKLAAQGAAAPPKPPIAAASNATPAIDLAKYKPIELPKQPDWIESEAGDVNGKGFYLETSDKGKIIKVQVGLWEKYNNAKEVVSRSCRNVHGVAIGPEIEYFTSETGTPGQIKSVSVNLGFLPTDTVEGVALTDLTPAKVRESKQVPNFDSYSFHKDGSLAKSFKYGTDGSTHQQTFYPRMMAAQGSPMHSVDGSVHQQAFLPGGVLSSEEIRKPDGMMTRRSYAPNGVLVEEVVNNVNDRKDLARIEKTWGMSGDLQKVMVNALRGAVYNIPVRSAEVPPDAKQVVNWNDPGDERKGIKSAGYATGANAEDRVGPWIEFNAQGAPVSHGEYKAGKQEGSWIEMEYEIKTGSGGVQYAERIATMKGRYAAGVKVGIWQTEYDPGHPVVREIKGKSKRKAGGLGGQAGAMVNGEKGYFETNTFSDGKVVKTDRNF